ncbi:hypothetical protein K458DRAFT_482909 [Lentithecium fluviatile CBS 122367]|uniref:SGNH hydrolase n=1 Tax=Lentithecium fluviatile CBS 122367 TaxID=1168545 RepID=A0A6G1JKM5_9PLEO|nr:hypothetical protein K458DRAFT_482909 [Lentithecium fluviatile CBS 122367]
MATKLLALSLCVLSVCARSDPQKGLSSTKRSNKLKLNWAAVGGSWISGVSFDAFGNTNYDSNTDECLRDSYSYPALIAQDNSWVPNGKEQQFQFAACARSKPEKMIDDHVRSPSVTLMQAGLDTWKLTDVLNFCIFQDQDKDYGVAFPSAVEEGECALAISNARRSIEGSDDWGVQYEIHNEIYNWWNIMGAINPDYRLYVIGYPDFFNTVEDATWCNNVTFARNRKTGQMLVMELRNEINILTQLINDKIWKAVQVINSGDSRVKVGFINPKDRFDGSRFCEGGHSLYDQYFGTKIKFWNRSPEQVVIRRNNNYQFREPTEDERKKWLETGRFTGNDNEVDIITTHNSTVPGPPSQDGRPGWALRAFLPNHEGHKMIAKEIMDRLRKDLEPTHSGVFRGNEFNG